MNKILIKNVKNILQVVLDGPIEGYYEIINEVV